MTAEVSGMKYVGSVGDTGADRVLPAMTDKTCDYYVGVLTNTGKVRVVQTQILELFPLLKDNEYTSPSGSSKSYGEKNDALTQEFGSGKRQRAVNTKLKNKLDESMRASVTQSAVDTSVAVYGEAKEAPVTVMSAVPPHNLHATRPEDVYKTADIIPPEILGALTEMSGQMYDSSPEEVEAWLREGKYPHFVLDRLAALSPREEARRAQCQCLVYISCLVKMVCMKGYEFKSKQPLPLEWNGLLRKYLLRSFTEEFREGKYKTRTFPSHLKDLMLSHVIILCLKMSGFCLNLTSLQPDLAIPMKKLYTHCKILGCTVKSRKDSSESYDLATLTVPLKFPEKFKKRMKSMTH